MSVEFLKAKNGSQTAKADGIFLHSAYNPEQEAQRFAQNAAADFIPQNIIVIEGVLSYCAEELRKKFEGARVGTIRLCGDFSASDGKWDFVLNATGNVQQPKGFDDGQGFESTKTGRGGRLSEQLYDLLGEEGIYKTLFLEWPPSARAFAQKTKNAWQEIKAVLEKAKAVLATREYFGKRWLKNKINFFCKIQNAATLERIERPVVICASGPSLAAAIPLIKKTRENIFLVALSSSLAVLLHNEIIPDLCFSTDGGYWAKKHIDALATDRAAMQKIPLALATEGECSSNILQNATIVPLCYDDDALSKKLFAALEMPFMTARRNGTVSGTALEFFLALTDKEIFFAGLDLAPGITFAHTQPNALEIEAAQKDFRLVPKATRIAKAALPSPSLDLYAAWFANYSWDGKQKVFRICGENAFKNKLGRIEDISAEAAEEKICDNNSNRQTDAKQMDLFATNVAHCKCNKAGIFKNNLLFCLEAKTVRASQIRVTLLNFSSTLEFSNELFPTDSILASRAANGEEKEKYKNIILKKTQKLLEEVFQKLK